MTESPIDDEAVYSRYTLTNNLTGDTASIPQVQPGVLKTYLLHRRRVLLAELAEIERILGMRPAEKKR